MERAITRARRARRAARCLLRPQSLTPSPETRTRRSSPPGSVRRWPRIAALLLATASAATCFTGDGLVDQPCQSDEDCNPLTDALGQSLRCEYNICGYSQRCGDGIVDDAREKCDDGDANVKADRGIGPGQCSASDCRLLPSCGDGEVHPPHESCDDASSRAASRGHAAVRGLNTGRWVMENASLRVRDAHLHEPGLPARRIVKRRFCEHRGGPRQYPRASAPAAKVDYSA